jgi:hypothetical protein
MKKLFLSAALAGLAVVGSVASAGDADAIIGTWQMNAAKSTFTPGPAPKSQTRTYSQSGASITIVIKTVGSDGKETTTQTTYQLDGKDYPITGGSDYDSISGKQVNPRTATFTLKKGGKTVGTTTRTVSKDGKILTSKMSVTTTKGEKSESTTVLEKQ